MIWLGLGTALLLWAALGNPGKRRMDWITGLCIGLAVTGAILSLRLYTDVAVLLIIAGASAAGLVARRFRRPGQRARLASLAIGAAAMAFALFGPADGLF